MLTLISTKFKFLTIQFICISVTLLLIPSTIKAQNRASHSVTIRVIHSNSFCIEPVNNTINKHGGPNVANKADGYNLDWKFSGADKRITVSTLNDNSKGAVVIAGERELNYSRTSQDITDPLDSHIGSFNVNYSGIEDDSEPVILYYTVVDS